jgi:hypothetical protein
LQAGREDEEACSKLQSDVQAFQEECARDLLAAEPIIAEAEAALNSLDKVGLGLGGKSGQARGRKATVVMAGLNTWCRTEGLKVGAASQCRAARIEGAVVRSSVEIYVHVQNSNWSSNLAVKPDKRCAFNKMILHPVGLFHCPAWAGLSG